MLRKLWVAGESWKLEFDMTADPFKWRSHDKTIKGNFRTDEKRSWERREKKLPKADQRGKHRRGGGRKKFSILLFCFWNFSWIIKHVKRSGWAKIFLLCLSFFINYSSEMKNSVRIYYRCSLDQDAFLQPEQAFKCAQIFDPIRIFQSTVNPEQQRKKKELH